MPLEEEGRSSSRRGGQSGEVGRAGCCGKLQEASSASRTVQVGSAQPRQPSTLAEVPYRGWAFESG